MAPDRLQLVAGVRRAAAAAAGCAALALAASAAAQTSYLYVCTVDGHTITDQQPPQACKNVDVRELNPDGTLHRLIKAPRSAEQIRKDKEAEDERLRQEEEARSQTRKDRALLETYSSVEEIEEARKRALQGRQTLIDRADARIAQYKKEKKRLDDEAEFYVNREMPRKLQDAFAANKVLTEQQEKTRADSVVEMGRINARFDADRARFEEIEHAAKEAEEARRRAEQGN